jgi:hypothetical protein
MGSMDPDPQSGSGSKRAKMTQRNRKHIINFIFHSMNPDPKLTYGIKTLRKT